MKQGMNPVKENRAYVKGHGACVNVDQTAYQTRLKRLQAEKRKYNEVQLLKDEVGELKEMVQQLLAKGK